MDYGLSFLPDCTGNKKTPYTYFKEAFELSYLADIGGLQYIKMTEHFLHPYGGYCPSPLSFLSAVAIKTKNIRLLTGCILPAFHHPIQIASETAMVDAISNGRLDVGFARAYLPYEFEAFGVDIDQSRNRFIDTIKAVIDLWKKPEVSKDSPFFQFRKANILPHCTQLPHPPIWGAAVNSRQSFAWLAENLFSLLVTPPMREALSLAEKINLYKTIFLDTAKDRNSLQKPKVIMSIPLLIDLDQSQALREGKQYLKHYLEIWQDAASSLIQKESLEYPGYEQVYYALKANTPLKMIEKKQALVGDPVFILDAIEELKQTFSLDGIIWQIDFGEQPFEVSQRTLRLFLEKVMPFLQPSKRNLEEYKPCYN